MTPKVVTVVRWIFRVVGSRKKAFEKDEVN